MIVTDLTDSVSHSDWRGFCLCWWVNPFLHPTSMTPPVSGRTVRSSVVGIQGGSELTGRMGRSRELYVLSADRQGSLSNVSVIGQGWWCRYEACAPSKFNSSSFELNSSSIRFTDEILVPI